MGARILIVDDSPTIRKVVASILERHDYVTEGAADGLEAIEKLGDGGGADLLLVDFVMPRMNGYQLCMALRQRDDLKRIPIVLMSAKGDKIRGRFVQQTGALDAITKPFDARGLLAVVESALEKKADFSSSQADSDDPLSSPRDRVSSLSTRTSRDALLLAEKLGKMLAPELDRLGIARIPDDELTRAFSHVLTPEAAAELATEVAALDLGGASGEVLSGDVSAVSIAEILQLLDMQKKTGALTLHHNRKRVTLFIREGALDFATYAGLPEEFLLGRYLVDSGGLSRDELDEHIDESRRSGRVLGDFLVERGVLSADDLSRALTQQTSELVYEVVRWKSGRFRFLQQADNALATRARLGLHTGGLVMEGFRRVDEWRLIEDSFEFGDVLFRDEMAIDHLAEQQRLTGDEQKVLGEIDGVRTVGELLDELEGGSFENCKILYRLLNSRLVRRRTQ